MAKRLAAAAFRARQQTVFSRVHRESQQRDGIRVQDNEKGEIVRLELSPPAAAASTVTFELVHLNWDYGYLNYHVEQIQNILAQMTKAPVVRIRFYCQVDECSLPYQGEDLVAKYKDELAVLEGIAKLELLELCAYGNAHQTEGDTERKLMASYTKSNGWKTYRVFVGEVEHDSDSEAG